MDLGVLFGFTAPSRSRSGRLGSVSAQTAVIGPPRREAVLKRVWAVRSFLGEPRLSLVQMARDESHSALPSRSHNAGTAVAAGDRHASQWYICSYWSSRPSRHSGPAQPTDTSTPDPQRGSRQASQARVSVKHLKTVRDYYDSVDRPLGLGHRRPTVLFRTGFTETSQCSDVLLVPAGGRPCSGHAVPGVPNRLIESNASLRNLLRRSCEPIRT
jgi:hypothetical protein